MKDVIALFKSARRVSTPVIAISTSDQRVLARRIFESTTNGDSSVPKMIWDSIHGLKGSNEKGKQLAAQIPVDESRFLPATLAACEAWAPPPQENGFILAVLNAHRYVDDRDVMQCIYNLRDPFCTDMRTLLLLGPSFRMPVELNDVTVFDEELPTDEALGKILDRLYESQDVEGKLEADTRSTAVDAARGLSSFAAEQVFAMALTQSGIDLEDAWERKKSMVNQTRGLKFLRGGPTFDSLGGLDSFKEFAEGIVNGPRRPGCVVFLDEVEKALAGASSGGDSSGVSQDFLGTFLTWMEERNNDGVIAVGMPGTGKTAAGMAMGASFGLPTVVLDVGGLKGQYVGQSEQALRDALKVIDSIAGAPGAFVFATCNRETSLPPEFKRRFRSGRWYFDLPTAEEREAIWKIHGAAFGVNVDKKNRPNDSDWTGAEIRNCCELAWKHRKTLIQAADYVIPVARSEKATVDNLRTAARQWLSASYPGPYRGSAEEVTATEPETTKRRSMNLKGGT